MGRNMAGVISIDDLANTITGLLDEYLDLTLDELEALKEDIAQRCVNRLEESSPKKYGDYRRGWRKKKVNSVWIVHNETDYQLTHLLEKGHANILVGTPTPAIPHIRPVELDMIDIFERELLQIFGG